MLQRFRVRWLVLLFVLVFAAFLGILGALLGLWAIPFGHIIQDILGNDALVKVLGTLLSGAITFFMAWRYNEHLLPELLNWYLVKSTHTILDTRETMLAAVTTPLPSAAAQTSKEARRGNRRLVAYIEQISAESSNPRGHYAELNKCIGLVDRAARQTRLDKASLHFVRGMDFKRVADRGLEPQLNYKRAIDDLKIAAELDREDVRIHRALLQLVETAGSVADVPAVVTGWRDAAAACDLRREVGLATCRLGECYFSLAQDPSLTVGERNERSLASRQAFETAVQLLQANPASGISSTRDAELAKALEAVGDVRAASTAPRAGQRYRDALQIYRALHDGAAIDRIKQKLFTIGQPFDEGAAQDIVAPPTVALITSMQTYARALMSNNECIAAQSILYNAKRRASALVVGNVVTAVEKTDLIALIDHELAEASRKT